MNLLDIHENKDVSAKPLSHSISTKVTAIQILSDKLLKEHSTNVPAVLLCVTGEVEYQDDKGSKLILKPGDFKEIEPLVKHWVKGIKDAQLVLIK